MQTLKDRASSARIAPPPAPSTRLTSAEEAAQCRYSIHRAAAARLSMAANELTITPALANDADALSALAIRSKAHWGYSSTFMAACRNELSYSPDQIDSVSFDFVVARRGGHMVAFYALERLSNTEFELEALFVEPLCIGQGLGGTLLHHACRNARDRGGTSLLIQSDPHADEFYRATGAVVLGERESSSVPGRFLSLFRVTLNGAKFAAGS